MSSKATVLYDYQPQGEDEVALFTGMEVTWIREESEGWSEVQTEDGTVGYIPTVYLKIQETSVNSNENNNERENCTAVYDYQDGGEHDLAFRKGDVIRIVERNDDGWFVGEMGEGKRGYFPANYTDVWSEIDGESSENNQSSRTPDARSGGKGTKRGEESGRPVPAQDQGDPNHPPARSSQPFPSRPSRPARRNATGTPSRRKSSTGNPDGEQLPTPPTKNKIRMRRKISFIDSPGKHRGSSDPLRDLRKKHLKRKNGGQPSRPTPNRPTKRKEKTAVSPIEEDPEPFSHPIENNDIEETNEDASPEDEVTTEQEPSSHKKKKKKKERKKSRKESRIRKTSEQIRNLNFGQRKGHGMIVDVLEIPNKEIKKCRNEKGEIIVLGEGSFGKVFKCLWQRGSYDEPPIEVAVKVVPVKVAKETLEKEVLTVKLLNHPSVVNVFGFSYLSSRKFGIVMEYVDGGTLFDLAQNCFSQFDTREPLTLYDKWVACRKMTEAIRFLHSRRVIHRDIKSLNFLISKDRKKVKICDFGLAKIKSETQTVDLKTGLKGTVRYMAPELSEESPKYGVKSDIFSLGMCFFEVCTGKIPFEKVKNEIQVLMMIMKGVVPEIPENVFVPDELKCLIELCLKKDPEERPTTEDIVKFMKERESIFIKNYPPPKRKKKIKPSSTSGDGSMISMDILFVEKMKDSFKCPLSGTIMKDPYILVESGVSYEKDVIEDYLEKNENDPITEEELDSKLVVPNIALKNVIEIWNESVSI